MHFNWNTDRSQATTESGKKAHRVKKLKYKHGKDSVSELKRARDFGKLIQAITIFFCLPSRANVNEIPPPPPPPGKKGK